LWGNSKQVGTAERKAKEKEELKELILQAAQKLFVDKGIDNTTIRNIAQEIEYSVGTVYVYYRDKNDILYDLHSRGFSMLGRSMSVLFHVSHPFERLKALGRTYIAFALENREMYDLMFNMRAPMASLKQQHTEKWNEGEDAFDVLRQTVSQCIGAGYFKGHQPEPLAFAIWSAVHGMCSLYIRERIQGASPANPERLLEEAFESLVGMMSQT
jgi:AcrR family transcriptional regulator